MCFRAGYHTSHSVLVNYNGVFQKKYSHQSHECTKVTPVTAPHLLKSALRAASVALLTTAVVGSGAPALAAGTHLCDGYRGCLDKGMSAAGYSAVNNRSFWRMYPGHNCTNYAAYRMIQSGMANERPWSGGGNAMYWGRHMAKYTDSTPRVGSIAWWDDSSPGHVAYVEKVISPSEIIISQDSWGGDFSWARVTKSYRWPSGFIHFNDRTLANRAAPTFAGTAKVGNDVRANAGSWSPSPTSVAYKWYVGDNLLPRARQATVRLTPWMRGKPLRVSVTASRYGYPSATVSSVVTDAILPGSIESVTAPRIGGVAQVNHKLGVNPGTWSPQPVTVAIQWLRDGQPIKGATSTHLTLTPRDAGHAVTATVTASRAGYDTVTRTFGQRRVALATMSKVRPSVVDGTALAGKTLQVRPGATNLPSTRSFQWLRDGAPISGATKPAYRLTPADVTHTLSARVTYARTGYRPVVETVGRRLVRSTVKLGSSRTRVGDGWLFDLRPTAGGHPLPDGSRVLIGHGGRVVAHGVVRQGHVRLRVTGLPRGKQSLSFFIPGTPISVYTAVVRRPYFR